MSEQSQTPEQPSESTAADVPAVGGSHAPTVSQPAAGVPPATEFVPPQFVPSPPSGPPDPPPQPSGLAAALPSGLADAINDRPELGVGGAFAGGFVLALILKRLAR